MAAGQQRHGRRTAQTWPQDSTGLAAGQQRHGHLTRALLVELGLVLLLEALDAHRHELEQHAEACVRLVEDAARRAQQPVDDRLAVDFLVDACPDELGERRRPIRRLRAWQESIASRRRRAHSWGVAAPRANSRDRQPRVDAAVGTHLRHESVADRLLMRPPGDVLEVRQLQVVEEHGPRRSAVLLHGRCNLDHLQVRGQQRDRDLLDGAKGFDRPKQHARTSRLGTVVQHAATTSVELRL